MITTAQLSRQSHHKYQVNHPSSIMRFFRLAAFAIAIGFTAALPTEAKTRDLETRTDVNSHYLLFLPN